MPQAPQKRFPHCGQSSATVATRLALIVLTLLALLVPRLTGQVQPITNIIATSAANFEVGVSQHGSISAIFCLGLQGIQGTVAANTVPLPRELAGVRVTIGGAAAPLFSVSAVNGYFQINVQTPLEAQFDERWDPKRVDVRIEQVAGPDQSRVADGHITPAPQSGRVLHAVVWPARSSTRVRPTRRIPRVRFLPHHLGQPRAAQRYSRCIRDRTGPYRAGGSDRSSRTFRPVGSSSFHRRMAAR